MAANVGNRKRGQVSDQRRLVWFPEALADLRRLQDFVFANNPTAAAKAAKRILEAAAKLRTHPFLGRPVEDISHHEFRDLSVAFGKAGYVLRYAVTDDAVILMKIWHSREDRTPSH
ncbi:type II toxin-antitoxin system RelE/ParE family toxin [Methylovulum psychrotolerans]|uniref:Type II toxin-antitoxin system RelE/ParE family toxin n=1 Tax=Methylovulum psychrotolerans TaxID=1704499 RepID=A0A2S5CGE1_9GAMM|nr:type II toxin-antitoxin system RelE/ParE family toxin [Methylovulum psychrotolerans]